MINPCGFPLLPAFLSFYLGADERRLPPAPTRALQGLLVGALVTVGFLGFFALVGLPVSYGVARNRTRRPLGRARDRRRCSHSQACCAARQATPPPVSHLTCAAAARAPTRARCCCSGSATAPPRSAARCRCS